MFGKKKEIPQLQVINNPEAINPFEVNKANEVLNTPQAPQQQMTIEELVMNGLTLIHANQERIKELEEVNKSLFIELVRAING